MTVQVSRLDELEKLGRLHAEGALDKAEFQRRKVELLTPGSAAASARRNLKLAGATGMLLLLALVGAWRMTRPGSPPGNDRAAVEAASYLKQALANPPSGIENATWSAIRSQSADRPACVIRSNVDRDDVRFAFLLDTEAAEFHYSNAAMERPKGGSRSGTANFLFSDGTSVAGAASFGAGTRDVVISDGRTFLDHAGHSVAMEYFDSSGVDSTIFVGPKIASALASCLQQQSAARSGQSPVGVATPTFDGVKSGLDYSVARARMIARGFRPAKISRGDEYDLCEMKHCPPFPEAIECSGTGLNECRFAFQGPDGRYAVATTVGEGDDPGLDRIDWASQQEAGEVVNRIAGRPAMPDSETPKP